MGKYLYNPKDQNLCKKYESDIGTIFFPLEIGDTVFCINSKARILKSYDNECVESMRSCIKESVEKYFYLTEVKYTAELSKSIEFDFEIAYFKSFQQACKVLDRYKSLEGNYIGINEFRNHLDLKRREKYYGSELFWGKN